MASCEITLGIRQKIRRRKTRKLQMAGTQVHNIDNMVNWQRERADELVMY